MIRKVDKKPQVRGTTWWIESLTDMVESTPKCSMKKSTKLADLYHNFVISCSSNEIAKKLAALLREVGF